MFPALIKKATSLVGSSREATTLVREVLSSFVQIQRSLQVSVEHITVIAGHLKHNPDEWTYIQTNHPGYLEITHQIKEVLSDIDWNNPIILEHTKAHWLVVVNNGYLLPVILINGLNTVGVYKLITGRAYSFLPMMTKWVEDIAHNQKFEEGVNPTLPYAVLNLEVPPISLREPKHG